MKKIHIIALVILLCSYGTVQAGMLYAVQEGTDMLVSINTDTMAYSTIGSLGVSFEFGGMAYDKNSSTLYMIGGRGNNNLYTVDMVTGQATNVGSHGIHDLFGLAFDTSNNVLYATQFSGGSGLYSLDTNTGSATTINPAMSSQIGGLAYDSMRDMLVGIQDGPGSLYNINRSDGSLDLLFSSGYVNDSGLAYDSDLDLFWDIDWNGSLYSYDPTTGARIELLSGLGAHDGLAYVSAVPVPAAIWLFGTGLLGLMGYTRKNMNKAA